MDVSFKGTARKLEGVKGGEGVDSSSLLGLLAKSGGPGKAAARASPQAAPRAVGRIEAALLGEEDWHEAAARPPPEPNAAPASKVQRVAVYKVVHEPAVIVREAPHFEAEQIGFKRHGTFVKAIARRNGWVQLQEQFEGRREGWMALSHEQYGDLLKYEYGDVVLPELVMQLAAPTDIKKAKPLTVKDTQLGDRAFFKVVHDPSVMIRKDPTLDGQIVGMLDRDRVVQAVAERGNWVRLKEKHKRHECDQWVLVQHPDLGRLLERCNADGSDLPY